MMAIRSPTCGSGSSRTRPNVSLLSQTGPTTSQGTSGRSAACNGHDAMERAVERRPHQFGHAGVEHHEASAAGVRLDVDDAREQHACGADQRAARLDDERQAGGTGDVDERPREGVVRGHVAALLVDDAESAPEVEMGQRKALGPQRHGQVGHLPGGGAQRPE